MKVLGRGSQPSLVPHLDADLHVARDRSARARRTARLGALVLGLTAAVLVAVAASLALGSQPVPLSDVVGALRDPEHPAATIVRDMRVPRTLLACLVGVALGVAGALTQAHTRNPLADPGLLGVTSGAACAVVVGIHMLGVTSPTGSVVLALAGAATSGVVVLGLSRVIKVAAPGVTLVLTGAIVSALLGSVTSGVLLLDRTTMDIFRFWSVGSLVGRGGDVIAVVAPFIVVGLVLAALNAPSLSVLELGDELGVALGGHVRRARAVGLLAVTFLVGGATAACGPVAFVGLAGAHTAARLVPGSAAMRIPVAGLCGAVLVLVADVLGRVLPATSEVQVGIVLGVIGAPLFVVLARGYGGRR